MPAHGRIPRDAITNHTIGTRARLNINTGNFHYRDKTVVRPSYIYYPLVFQTEGVLSSPAYVHPSVRPSVRPPTLTDSSSQISPRITKFSPNMPHWILSVGIENGGYLPRTSRSFWSFWLTIPGNLACPRDSLHRVWARITEFAPSRHIGIENGCNWPRLSRSFRHFEPGNAIQRRSFILV